MSNVPKLRFREFSGEWEEKVLNSIASFSKGKGISKSDIDENGQTECIRYGELYTQYNELIQNVISKTNVNSNDLILSEYGDIIIPASGETQIDIATASCILKDNVALGGDLNIIKSKEDGVFLSYYLNNAKKFDIARLSQGISVVHLYSSQLKTLKLNLPSKQEQEKIASFLTSVDTKIEQLTKKEELLGQYKKGVMQKIFNQEIRFKADDGSEFSEWREEKVSAFMIERNIKTPKSKEYPLMAFVAYKGVTDKGDRYNREFLVNDGDNKKYKQTEYGDFIYSSNNLETGSIGLNRYGSATISPVYSVFQITESCDYKFISTLLKTKSFINKMIRYRQGVVYGQWRIHESHFLNIKVDIPCIQEQTKIANFLSSIDTKIEQVQNQLKQTKEFKKALLQQMFV